MVSEIYYAGFSSFDESPDKKCVVYSKGASKCDCSACAAIMAGASQARRIPNFFKLEWREGVPHAKSTVPLGHPNNPLRSQKAIGVNKLGSLPFTGSVYTSTNGGLLSNVAARGTKYWSIEYQCDLPEFPFFARPCPMRPRHGFVDSRPIHTQDEWDALVAEIQECDEPDCEVMLMPLVKATFSGIITPNGVTLGPGNDGATSGHDSVSIPGSIRTGHFPHMLLAGGAMDSFAVKDTPFVEIVSGYVDGYESQSTEVVQVRDGPNVPLVQAYVPRTMRVENVVIAGGDLLEWESTAANLPEGTVVWHPGGNMSSHYAVHCVLNDVPVICTDDEPQVGDTLEPMGDVTQPDGEALALMAKAIEHFADQPISTSLGGRHEALRLAVGALHASASWGDDPHLMKLRGAAVAKMMHLTQLAVMGESRHVRNSSKYTPGKYSLLLPPSGDRKMSYGEVAEWNPLRLAREMRFAYHDFSQLNWSPSYGGKKWANCARQTLLLHKVAATFCAKPTRANYVRLWTVMNRIVHLAHNGGLFLDKHAHNLWFDVLSKSPAIGLFGPLVWKAVTADVSDASYFNDDLVEAYTLQRSANYPEWFKDRLELTRSALEHMRDLHGRGIYTLAEYEEEQAAHKAQLELKEKLAAKAAKQAESEAAQPTKSKFSLLVDAINEKGGSITVLIRQAGDGRIKVQGSCSPVNRAYGFTFEAPCSYSTWEFIGSKPRTHTSLANSDVLYATATFEVHNQDWLVLRADGATITYHAPDLEHRL